MASLPESSHPIWLQRRIWSGKLTLRFSFWYLPDQSLGEPEAPATVAASVAGAWGVILSPPSPVQSQKEDDQRLPWG